MIAEPKRRRVGGCRFTVREIEPLIGNGRVVWDDALPGFGLRFSGSGRRTWIVFTRIKGIVSRISLGGPPTVTETEARTKAQLLILEAKVRRDPLARKRDAKATPLLSEFAHAYRRYGATRWKPSTVDTYDCYMRTHLLPTFGKRFLDQIDEPSVFEWFSRLSRTRGGAANRALSLLNTMFKKAEEWGQVPSHFNPCGGIEKNAQRVFRRYLSEPELLRLGRALDALEDSEPVRVGAIRLLLYTGCRKSEVLSLRWSDIAGRLMTLRDSKTGPRQVDLGPAAQEALRRVLRQTGNPWVFPSPIRPGQRLGDLLPFWHSVVLPKAKITPLRLHDLRHTFASHAAIQQENTPMIAKLLGHSGTDNTQRYMHLADQPALDAAELVSGLLWAALSRNAATNQCAGSSTSRESLIRSVSLDAERSADYMAS